jgi:hypothetical protein
VLTLSAPVAAARAQTAAPISFDPDIARQGTALVLGVDGTALSSDGQLPSSITAALPRGTRADTAAREELCSGGQAARGTCPAASRIGFGRYVVTVTGFLAPGGQTQLTWAIDAFLGRRAKPRDVASVVLVGKLLGADNVSTLLAPKLGVTVPSSATSTGRLIRKASGKYGVELQLPGVPVDLQVPSPSMVTPARLELNLSAVRRTRQNFIRRYRIRTLSGYVIRKVRDHRLVGHNLLRTPRSCGGSWPYELRVAFPGGVQRTAGHFACTKAF